MAKDGINRAIILGRLGSAPESRQVNGKSVCTISLATSNKWLDNKGVQQEQTQWHRVVFWGRVAEVIAANVKTGEQLYIEGEITYRKYQDRSGNDKFITEIRGEQFQFIGGGSRPAQPQQHQRQPQTQNQYQAAQQGNTNQQRGYDDDMGF